MNLESTLLLKKTVFNVKKKRKTTKKDPFKKAGTNIFLLVFKLLFFFLSIQKCYNFFL